jgi:hypothetical protein
MSILSLRGVLETRLADYIKTLTSYSVHTGQSTQVNEVNNLVFVNCERIQIHPEMMYHDGNWQASIRITVLNEYNTEMVTEDTHRQAVKAIVDGFTQHQPVQDALSPILVYRYVIEAIDEQLENNSLGTGMIISIEFCDVQT